MEPGGKDSSLSQKAVGALRRHSDLMLALAVAGVVGMMILPLPTPLLDVLIAANLTLAVTLLLVSIYVSDALRIATFPSILLVATLFRLGLNVSSTRLILLQADAGRVIDAFGDFVVRGNYVVGAVVFLILTIIQFVVIAKGSERVAEVAARFTLDALPGKQMAIDADLRAGLLDQAAARRARRALQRESQFYGAMDGAMKFVKGDAIAGIIITLVNIVAGLAIGVLQRDMDAGQALRVYGLLTIGDGLVSQIPALVISMAAGLVVTRVASEEEGAHLGEDISYQILAHPRALAIVSGLLILLALVPGLPAMPFLLLGALCGVTAFALMRASKAESDRSLQATDGEEGVLSGGPRPVTLELGAALSRDRDVSSALAPALSELRSRLYGDLGIRVPPIRVRGRDEGDGAERGFSLSLDEIPISKGSLELANEEQRERSDVENIVAHLDGVLRREASHFLGLQDVQRLLDDAEATHPALVRALVPEVMDLPLIADVMRRLAEEGISVRNLKALLEALLDASPSESKKDPLELTELVRSSLSRQITHRYAGGEPTLEVYALSPEIEEEVRSAVRRSERGTYLALEPDLSREIIEAIKATIHMPEGGREAILLTQPDVRRLIWKLIELDVPEVAVLSHQDLDPEVVIKPLARINLEGF